MRKLAWITVSLTYLLMVWGNLVSSTGSGLACPDWPLCHGTLTPAISFPVVLEWGHRLLAATTSFFIISTILRVLFSRSLTPAVKRSGRSLIALLAIQILLGGTTVLLGLSVLVSTVHLILASIVFAGLIALACVTTWENPVVPNSTAKVRRLAVSALGAMLLQLALGALVRHNHAGLACPAFPGCLDGFFPIPLTFETALAFIHRWWGFALLGVYVHLARTTAQQTPALARASRNALKLAIAQVILGIGTVASGLNTHSRATHAAVGYLLWGTLFYISFRAGAFSFFWRKPERKQEPVFGLSHEPGTS